MAENTHIQWTDHSANFWHGCMKVSPGCANCYAESESKRFGRDIFGPAATTERWRTTSPWKDILKWDKKAKADGVRRRVFVQSMSDTFEDHPQLDEWRAEALDILGGLQWLDVQLLTKRPENVARMVPLQWMEHWPEHIWLGTSVENEAMADKRIPELLKIPAAIRFMSVEPLLGPVTLRRISGVPIPVDALTGGWSVPRNFEGQHQQEPRIHWIIVGGESGPKARPMSLEWARWLVQECRDTNTPVFVKQFGSVLAREMGLKHSKGGDLNEWPDDLRVRQFPRSLFRSKERGLAAFWPTMPDLEGGRDLFDRYPIAGESGGNP